MSNTNTDKTLEGKQNLEDEIKNLKAKSSTEKVPVSISDFESFKLIIQDLLENEADPKIKTTIIQKIVHKIVIKNEEVSKF